MAILKSYIIKDAGQFTDSYLCVDKYHSPAISCYLAALSPLLRSVEVWDAVIFADVSAPCLNQLLAYSYRGM